MKQIILINNYLRVIVYILHFNFMKHKLQNRKDILDLEIDLHETHTKLGSN